MTNIPDHAPATPDLEVEQLRAELDRYANAYRKLIDQLEKKRIESDEGARAIQEKKVRGKDGQLIPHECAIAISGLAGGYLTATVLAINLFEGAEARTAYLQRTLTDSTPQAPDTETKVTVTVTPDPPALQREVAHLRRGWPGGRV